MASFSSKKHSLLVLKVKLYAANFPCTEPYGHVCKYALSLHEDDYSVHLEAREHATTFIIRKPGLDGSTNSLSFEFDDHRGYYLKRDGVKFMAQKGLIGASGKLKPSWYDYSITSCKI